MRYSFIALLLLNISFCHAEGIKDAEAYNKNSHLQTQWAFDSLEKYSLKGDERVLDVGCGDGKVTAYLSDTLSKGVIIGSDISPEIIKFASTNFSPKDFPNLFFMTADARSLPFKDQFDLVVSFCCLHWIKEQKAALFSMRNTLLPGGKLLLIVPAKGPNNITPISKKLVESEKWSPYFPNYKESRFYFTKQDYETLMIETGFDPIQIEQSTTLTHYVDKAALIDWLNPLITFTTHLKEPQKEQFINDIAEAMISANPVNPDGSITIHSDKLEILAQKPIPELVHH